MLLLVTSFNKIRDYYGLAEYESALLQRFYGDDGDDVDFFIGGLVESQDTGEMGATFSSVIVEQFLRLRAADPNWFENFQQNQILTGEEVSTILNTTFANIISAVLDRQEL